jgi:NAD(P)H-quinone oxidoreductase subunit 5
MHWSTLIVTSPIHLLAALVPVLLLGTALVPFRNGLTAARTVSGIATLSFITALAACVLRAFSPAPAAGEIVAAGLRIPLQADPLALGMLLLVSLLLAVVTRFSCNSLAGEPRQNVFMTGLAQTGGAVAAMTVSGSLLVFALAWVATSLLLHGLLTFYRDRPGALNAARRKFVVSRIGDLCVLGALTLTWQTFGTWNFPSLFAQAEALRSGPIPQAVGWISALLGMAALLKSAQIPFHGWLPDTMETPTPVSALMHAGIINAGGFLVVRLSPLFAASPRVLDTLALVGAATALFGSVVMLTQTSIKRALAYSTIAQMGFMMLECGLGAFALAVLHLFAHSLYKAYAFLSSGSIIRIRRLAWVPTGRPASHPGVLLAAFATSALLVGVGVWLSAWNLQARAGELLLASVLGMAVTHLLWNLWSSSHRKSLALLGLTSAAATVLGYFVLHAAAEHLLASCLPAYAPDRHPLEFGVMGLIAVLFSAVLIFQEQLPAWGSSRILRRLYVHTSQRKIFQPGFRRNLPENA